MSERWLFRHRPQKSLLLCSPFLRGGTLERILDFAGFPNQTPELELQVLFRGLKRDFLQGASDLAAVELLKRMKVQCGDRAAVRLLSNLHMKAYLVDGEQLLITSGNCTGRGFEWAGAEANVEGGIATDDPAVIDGFRSCFQAVWEAAAPLSRLAGEYLRPEFRDQVLRAAARPAVRERRYGYTIPSPPSPGQARRAAPEDEGQRLGIPQHYTPSALEATIRFLGDRRDTPELCTMTELARVLGSKAVKPSDRNRKLTGLVTNLRLLGLVEDHDCRHDRLPALTPLGIQYVESDPAGRRRIFRRQVMLLPWFSEAMELEPKGRPSGQALQDYLCGSCGYKPSSSKRYAPAMKHMLEACGFGEED